jgi:hypothetical protein
MLFGARIVADATQFLAYEGGPYRHVFYRPVEHRALNFSLWSINVAPTERWFFSFYDRGAVVNPCRDERFAAAFQRLSTPHVARHRNWTDCYFDSLPALIQFIAACHFQ